MVHQKTICTSCRHNGSDWRPGYELNKPLRQTIAHACDALENTFKVSGVARMACITGCDRPCVVAYHGRRMATYLFGDIDPEADLQGLISFAWHYANLQDGWCTSEKRPGKPRSSTPARVPAAGLVCKESKARAS